MIDEIDKKILNTIQEDFPLNERPFKLIAEKLDINEEEVLQRVSKMKSLEIIKAIKATFNMEKLNYKSTLVAVKVPEERLKEVVGIINELEGVTHNYKRNHEYNVWFTLIAEDKLKIKGILNNLKQRIRLKNMIKLDSLKTFKLKLNFKV